MVTQLDVACANHTSFQLWQEVQSLLATILAQHKDVGLENQLLLEHAMKQGNL